MGDNLTRQVLAIRVLIFQLVFVVVVVVVVVVVAVVVVVVVFFSTHITDFSNGRLF